MVAIDTVRERNSSFARSCPAGLVCVFMGATSGIGASTMIALATLLPRPIFYVIGRNEQRFRSQQEKELKAASPHIDIHFLPAEISLIADVDAVCRQIAAQQTHVDLLYMSAGLIPTRGVQYTREGLDTCMALSYYSRIRLATGLLPQLRRSSHARVLSVLNGGNEGRMHDDDLGLAHNYSAGAVIGNTTTMTSLVFSQLAAQNPSVQWLHSYPGWVKTEIASHVVPADDAGQAQRWLFALLRAVLRVLLVGFGMTPEECGERQAFYLTAFAPAASSKVEGEGSNVARLGYLSDEVAASSALRDYFARKSVDAVWAHTEARFESALAAEK